MSRLLSIRWVSAFALLALLAACQGKSPQLPRIDTNDVVLAFGDSLTFGTGAAESESYPMVLAGLIKRNVVRAGVPGEITAQGLQRLPGLLEEHRPKIVVLCLGGNDMLRRIDDKTIITNLREMIQIIRRQGASVVLLGVPKPALFGGAAKFYGELAKELAVPYEGEVITAVLRDNALKSDPIHPNANGYRRIAEQLAAFFKKSGAI
jgi:lysophospholipase L1-like esterase